MSARRLRPDFRPMLRCELSRYAAEILGVADRLGSIEPGKIANLVVADGDLFAEKTKVKHVFVDGRHFEVHEIEKPHKPGDGDKPGGSPEVSDDDPEVGR